MRRVGRKAHWGKTPYERWREAQTDYEEKVKAFARARQKIEDDKRELLGRLRGFLPIFDRIDRLSDRAKNDAKYCGRYEPSSNRIAGELITLIRAGELL